MSVREIAAKFRGTWRLSFVLAIAAAASIIPATKPAIADYTDGVVADAKISREAALRIWRKAAWQDDDFLSEFQLGSIYGDERGDNKFFDPVESYVWLYLATRSDSALVHVGDWHARRVIANDLHFARDKQEKLLLLLNAEQRQDARNRIVYILACGGADGFIKLGQLHSTVYTEEEAGTPWTSEPDFQIDNPDTFSSLSDVARNRRAYRNRSDHEPDSGKAEAERKVMGIPGDSVIVPNDGEALLYFHIADAMGHPLAREYIRTVERHLRDLDRSNETDPRRSGGLGQRIIQEAAEKAPYWYPPYEFYPAGQTASGVPYTDECYVNIDKQKALVLAAQIPSQAIMHALAFLGFGNAASRFQMTLVDAPTGRFTASEAVRLIQTAAIRGDAGSQNALGVMYAKGVGVLRNFVRAEFWFRRAADQRYAAALYHLGVLYKVGPDGIRQDLSKSNDYMTASALAGFRPTMNQLQDLLIHAEAAPRRPGQH